MPRFQVAFSCQQVVCAMKTNVILLAWNDGDVVRKSLEFLEKEPQVTRIILVDNGSWESLYVNELNYTKLVRITLSENFGPSYGRNVGLALLEADADYVFLLDGDIQYVPGTIGFYLEIMLLAVHDYGINVGCVGYHNPAQVQSTGQNGVGYEALATPSVPVYRDETHTVSTGFPMAWTQYGLFTADALSQGFVTEGVFGSMGHGYEDDWLFREMESRGLVSLSIPYPVYYHKAHNGRRNLESIGVDTKTEKRMELYESRFGDRGWRFRHFAMEPVFDV